MFLVEQRSDDGVQAYGFSLTSGACDQYMWHFAQVSDVDIVCDSLAKCNRKFQRRFLKFFVCYDVTHRHNARFGIRDFDADSPFSGDGGDDADALSCQAQGYVTAQIADFGNAHTLCGR